MAARQPSRRTGLNLREKGPGFSRRINDFFILGLPEVELFVPYDKQGVIGDIRRNPHIVREDYQKDGLYPKVKADPKMVTALKKRIAAQRAEPTKFAPLFKRSARLTPAHFAPILEGVEQAPAC